MRSKDDSQLAEHDDGSPAEPPTFSTAVPNRGLVTPFRSGTTGRCA